MNSMTIATRTTIVKGIMFTRLVNRGGLESVLICFAPFHKVKSDLMGEQTILCGMLQTGVDRRIVGSSDRRQCAPCEVPFCPSTRWWLAALTRGMRLECKDACWNIVFWICFLKITFKHDVNRFKHGFMGIVCRSFFFQHCSRRLREWYFFLIAFHSKGRMLWWGLVSQASKLIQYGWETITEAVADDTPNISWCQTWKTSDPKIHQLIWEGKPLVLGALFLGHPQWYQHHPIDLAAHHGVFMLCFRCFCQALKHGGITGMMNRLDNPSKVSPVCRCADLSQLYGFPAWLAKPILKRHKTFQSHSKVWSSLWIGDPKF